MKNAVFILLLCFFHCHGFGQSMTKELLHSTIKITCLRSDGKTSIGTGFFYDYLLDQSNHVTIPVIVTCEHVIENAVEGELDFALKKTNSFDRLQPHFGVMVPDFESLWIKDPDSNIDIAVLPIAPMMTRLQNEGKILDVVSLNDGQLPNSNQLADIGVFQNIKFIGYPIGVSDEVNNLPIAREGITATDPTIDYNGKKVFLIDASVFPGSSGSPVLVLDQGSYLSGGGIVFGPGRLYLLGIVDAVATSDASGRVVMEEVPTALGTNTVTAIPANLGIVIKAEVLNDFRPLFGGRPSAMK